MRDNDIFVGDYVMHLSGVKGVVTKNYKPSGEYKWYARICTDDNREYYAPECEFRIYGGAGR